MVGTHGRNDDELVAGLARWLAAHRGLADPVILDVRRPSAGYSSETVFVDGSLDRRRRASTGSRWWSGWRRRWRAPSPTTTWWPRARPKLPRRP